MAVAAAARHIIVDGAPITIGGGVESVSLVMNERQNYDRMGDAWQREHYPSLATSMIETAEVVAERYRISREAQDEFGLVSQHKAEAAQKAGRFAEEIAPVVIPGKKGDVVVDQDEYIRHGATLELMQKLRPASPRTAASPPPTPRA
jgi:acetyl-CoA C-acetyltransferase